MQLFATQPQTDYDWLERRAASLIARAKLSEWSRDIFDDADYFISEGYSPDSALTLALRYWEK